MKNKLWCCHIRGKVLVIDSSVSIILNQKGNVIIAPFTSWNIEREASRVEQGQNTQFGAFNQNQQSHKAASRFSFSSSSLQIN